jgi:hypothetical protein
VPHEMAKEDETAAKDADTELARAAQQLVDSVADNESDKFRNSAFLALMRRIASQQLTVQGNDLVEAPQPTAETSSDSHMTSETSATTPITTNRPVSTTSTVSQSFNSTNVFPGHSLRPLRSGLMGKRWMRRERDFTLHMTDGTGRSPWPAPVTSMRLC